MNARRWWLLAVAGTAVLCVLVLGLHVGIGPRFWIGAAVLAAFVAFWAIVVVDPDCEDTPRSIFALVVTIAVTAAVTATDTSLAFFQVIAFPAAWTLLGGIRRSVLACAMIAITVAIAFMARLGFTIDALLLAGTIEGISFVFAIAMGVWITRIADFGKERKRLLDELTAAQAQLEMLHRDAGATDERERLARELHDTIAQTLTGQVLLTQRARRELAAGALTDATLELLESSSREALTETRSLVAAGARVELPGGGLVAALEQLAARFQRESGIAVTVASTLSSPLDRDTEVVLLRCAQEGLANARKHAGAHTVRVELGDEAGEKPERGGGFARVTVIDDGHGFDPDVAASAGFGLSGLRDRLALVGGTLSIDGTPGATTLTARVPLQAAS
ncbi:MAG: sensor histidine kinase [Pseudolysinimonas sp.]